MAGPRLQGFYDLTRRFPVGVISLLLCLPLGLAAYLLWVAVTKAEVEYESVNATGMTVAEAVAGARNSRSQAAMTRAAVQQVDAGLIDESNLAENLWYFYQLEGQTKAHLSELHQLNSPALTGEPMFKVVPFSLRVSGTYEQVANYLYRLETGPRLLRISGYELQRQDINGSLVLCTLSVDVLARP